MGWGIPWMGIFFWAGLFTWLSIVAWGRYLREKERQTTLRAFAESGKPLDAETLEKLFPRQPVWVHPPQPWAPKPGAVARGLMIAGLIVLFLGVGILIGAQLIGNISSEALWGMSTGGTIVGCIGLGFIAASIVTRRSADKDEGRAPQG